MAIAFARPNYVGRSSGGNACCKTAYNSRSIVKDQNILMVEVNSSSTSVEIAFQQDVIIERLAVYMGYKAIDKIRTIVLC